MWRDENDLRREDRMRVSDRLLRQEVLNVVERSKSSAKSETAVSRADIADSLSIEHRYFGTEG